MLCFYCLLLNFMIKVSIRAVVFLVTFLPLDTTDLNVRVSQQQNNDDSGRLSLLNVKPELRLVGISDFADGLEARECVFRESRSYDCFFNLRISKWHGAAMNIDGNPTNSPYFIAVVSPSWIVTLYLFVCGWERKWDGLFHIGERWLLND